MSGHGDEILNRLIEAQAIDKEVSERGTLIRDIQWRLLEEAYMAVLVTEVSVWAAWPEVEGFYPDDALSEYFFWAKVSVGE